MIDIRVPRVGEDRTVRHIGVDHARRPGAGRPSPTAPGDSRAPDLGHTAAVPAPRTNDFTNAYRHAFARVAAATLKTSLADPPANAESLLAVARECHDEAVGVVVFPELTL